MIGPAWRWVRGLDDPPAKPRTTLPDGPTLRAQILECLNDDDPALSLRVRWPEVPPTLRVAFLIRVRVASTDAEEDNLVTGYEQIIRAHQQRRRWRRKGTQ